jgi:hypothetical protein
MTMPDAVEAILKLAAAPKENLTRCVYNVAGFAPSAADFERLVMERFSNAKITFEPDLGRQSIVDSWPEDVNDAAARKDWGWSPKHDMQRAFDEYLMPRIVALGLMMPLLALYANGVGIMGGMVVASIVLEIPPTAYWIETQSIVDLSDVGTGLFKALTFGLLIGLSGCLRGLQAERSAMGVGRAATSAVVTAILLIIVSNTFFAVAFNILGV